MKKRPKPTTSVGSGRGKFDKSGPGGGLVVVVVVVEEDGETDDSVVANLGRASGLPEVELVCVVIELARIDFGGNQIPS